MYIFLSTAAYGTPQASAQGYSQSAQGYGTSSYANSTAAAPAQTTYGTQPGYSAQTAYPGYGQQAASAQPRCLYTPPHDVMK